VTTKIAIMSNCQGEGLANCINAMSPDVEATFFLSSDFNSGKHDMNSVFSTHDKVFAQFFVDQYMHDGVRGKTLYFPSIAFAGYHPDMTYLRGHRSGGGLETVIGPMDSYHSALAVLAFTSGLDIDAALGLYSAETFTKLGYFEMWESSRSDLLLEGERTSTPLAALFHEWTKNRCFMYSFNHPHISAIEDIARSLLQRAGIEIVNQNVAQFVDDPLKLMPIWPRYPAIAHRYGGHGDYNFYCGTNGLRANLRQFLEFSYDIYKSYEPISLETLNFSLSDMKIKLGIDERTAPVFSPKSNRNPYAGLPSFQFWKDSVAGVPAAALDPVVKPSFKISPAKKIATAGSCFAQHIARTLSESGFNYFVAETAPEGVSDSDAKAENYGVFSARYGNVYTVRQLRQLLDRAYGCFAPHDVAWTKRGGGLVDPFRPQISPAGFADLDALLASREVHFAAVRRVVEDSNVFVFTLGLTEGWRSRFDGAVFPLAPGVAGGEMDFDRYEFVNFTYEEIVSDLFKAVDKIQLLNRSCRIILTVSPVPLIATYEPRHALVATTYSKSVLRAAAECIARAYDHVEYFPSYEIITGSYSRGVYFDPDLRTVTSEGVSHVMKIFMHHYALFDDSPTSATKDDKPAEIIRKPSALFEIVCDEEAIANFHP